MSLLKRSIKHWREDYLEQQNLARMPLSDSCPLCQAYRDEDDECTNEDGETCPIMEAVVECNGDGVRSFGCKYTPWISAAEAYKQFILVSGKPSDFINAAKDEVRFLEALASGEDVREYIEPYLRSEKSTVFR